MNLSAERSLLLTDLYQLTMLKAYFDHGMNETAVFEFFVRVLPDERNFLVAAGLEQVLVFLENLKFEQEELDWLSKREQFKDKKFISFLEKLRFNGDVYAMPEGTIFFKNEPILRITAPITIAQLIETRIINILHFQTMVASKAARIALAAPDKLLVDFGLRRAHGAEAGLFAARASYLAGLSGTATVLAGNLYGIPLYGTIAHSFIQAHKEEFDAFKNFAHSHPDNVVLLIDTYDLEEAVSKVIKLSPELFREGISIGALRLDSGDHLKNSKLVRKKLDENNLTSIKIFASGNLDEYSIDKLMKSSAPIDGFGIGTKMVTSSDSPFLECAYKLEEYAGTARRKRSEGKETLPGRKQVYRYFNAHGKFSFDVLTLEEDKLDGEKLIKPFMKAGGRLAAYPALHEIRKYAKSQMDKLPVKLKSIKKQKQFTVKVSKKLSECVAKADEKLVK